MSSLSKSLDNIKIDDILEKAKIYIDDEEQINIIKKAYEYFEFKLSLLFI